MTETVATPRALHELYFELGQALAQTGRREEAVDAFRRAGEEAGDLPGAGELLMHLGKALEELGEASLALRSYLGASRSDRSILSEALGRAHQLLSRRLAAVDGMWIRDEWAPSFMEDGLRGPERGDAAFFLGRVNLYLDEPARARRLFEEASKARPGDARVLEGLGEALWRTGDLGRAVGVLGDARNAAAERDPERVPLVDGKLAQVLAAAGRYDEALARIGDSVDESSRYADELLVIISECQLAAGRPEEALGAAERALERRPRAADAHLLRARALVALKRFNEASKAIDDASRLEPSSDEPLAAKAQALIEGQIDIEHGLHLLRRLAERTAAENLMNRARASVFPGRSHDGDARHFLARVLEVLGRHEDALSEVEEALSIGLTAVDESPDAPAKQLKAELLAALGRPDEAAGWHRSAGIDFYWRSAYETAAEQLQRAIELQPEDISTYWYLTDALLLTSYADPDAEAAEARLTEAVEAWDQGATLSLPDADYSWAYISRAVISERRADLGLAPEWTARWEGIVYLERAIVLVDEEARRWTVLARLYRNLGFDGCAIDAGERAVELAPAAADALSEVAGALANVGRFTDALEAIDRTLALEPSSWANAVRAYVLLRTDEVDEALELLNASIEESPDDPWFRELRALGRQLKNEREAAQEDFEWIWSHRAESRDTQTIGSAAYELGLFKEARELFEPMLDDRLSRDVARRYLAFTALASGDVAEGERELNDVIDSMVNPRDLDDLVDFELAGLAKRLADREGVKAVARLRERARKQRRQASVVSPRQELDRLAADDGQMAEPWTRVGVLAGLARQLGADAELERSEEIYADLRDAIDAEGNQQFPEAVLAQARVTGVRGLAAARASRPGDALACFRRSLQLRTEFGVADPTTQLFADLSAKAPERADYHALIATIRLFERAAETEERRSGLRAARRSAIAGRNPNVRRPLSGSAQPLVAFNPPFPLVLDADARLFPEGGETPEVGRMIEKDIPAMRDRVRAETGVLIPGVNIRPLEGAAGEYRVLVHEVPVHTGRLETEEQEGDPHGLLIRRLGTIVASDFLPAFVGVQETENALETWMLEGEDSRRTGLRAEAIPDWRALVRLARVIRNLAAETIPVHDFERILRAFGDANREAADVQDVVERVRLALADLIPGRSEAVPLPPELEETAARYVEWDGQRRLAVPPVEAVQLIQSAGAQLMSVPPGGAVVVRTPGLRPFVARLLADELPGVRVLAAAEVEAA